MIWRLASCSSSHCKQARRHAIYGCHKECGKSSSASHDFKSGGSRKAWSRSNGMNFDIRRVYP